MVLPFLTVVPSLVDTIQGHYMTPSVRWFWCCLLLLEYVVAPHDEFSRSSSSSSVYDSHIPGTYRTV